MKQKLYLLLLLLGPFWAHSQTSVPFPTQNANWRFGLYDGMGNRFGAHFFWLDGDSTYLGETWTALYKDSSPEGLIRQDSSLKVWIVPNGLTSPELLYDYGAAVGDTIKNIKLASWSAPFYTDTVVVTHIDSVFNIRTWHLKSINYDVNDHEFEWYEGIGDARWLPGSHPVATVSVTPILECFDSQEFFPVIGNGCFVANDEALAQRLQVSPNPSSGKFRLDFDVPMEINGMQVLDAQGRLVRIYDGFRQSLDLEELEPGIYFLRLDVNEGRILTRKLMLL